MLVFHDTNNQWGVDADFLSKGVQFIEPIEGKLACGTSGEGHLAAEEDIVEAVIKAVSLKK